MFTFRMFRKIPRYVVPDEFRNTPDDLKTFPDFLVESCCIAEVLIAMETLGKRDRRPLLDRCFTSHDEFAWTFYFP
jgi:hypothetical protein